MNGSTDRELLELAAKAAGWNETRVDERGWFYVCTYQGDPKEWELWNPSTQDGDALRLAVKRRMEIDMNDVRHSTIVYAECPIRGAFKVEEQHGDDPYAATRRAIFRAAAAIGEAMP